MISYNLRKYIIGCIAVAGIVLSSCSDDTSGFFHDKKPLKVYVTLDKSSAGTRAILLEDMDKWSYRDFSDGDELGLYAASRINPQVPFLNVDMLYSVTDYLKDDLFCQFSPVEGETFDATQVASSGVFLYFPYSNQMPTDKNQHARGMELRRQSVDAADGVWRCVDFLSSSFVDVSDLDQGTISAEMAHAFSELIIMRGDGFDHPSAPSGEDPYKIIIALKKPFTHVKIDYTLSPWGCNIALTNNDDYAPDNVSDFDAKLWQAWKGGNYALTEKDKVGLEAWYAILPTLGDNDKKSAQRTQVDYIQLYDNEGTLQTIKDLHLDGSSANMLTPKWRYPMVIAMQELVPTIFPCTIVPWTDGTITNKRIRGIYANTFEAWLNEYTAYLNDNRSESFDKELSKYGDKIIVNNKSRWHFYLFETINLTGIDKNVGCIIPELQDTLDGKTAPAASSVSIVGLNKPFIDRMTGSNAALINLTVDAPKILQNTASDNTLLPAAGCLVNTVTSGAIENCIINQGYLYSNGPVGMLCGALDGGKINECTASGVLLGTSSDSQFSFLAGSVINGGTQNKNSSSVIFNNIRNEGN
ncbi:MAG: hypothetical protein J1F10_03020 [Muribaculaceae bacterium]|nr:hypothetical protein [Muribaculaceae bacterium]